MFSFSRLLKFTFFTFVIGYALQQWLITKNYMVDYKDIQAIAEKNTVPGAGAVGGGSNVQAAFANIEKQLRKKYKNHIIPAQDTQWIFVNCGGWMGHMYILHASLTEYILFFGTAIDTSGHSGRYWANITDTMISGSYTQWSEGDLGNRVYKAGDTIVHSWGDAAAVQWSAGTYMVEYGRGFIPSTLGFALADTLFGTTDFITLYYTLRIYACALANEVMVYLDL